MILRLTPARAPEARQLAGIVHGWSEEVPFMPPPDSPAADAAALASLIDRGGVTVARRWHRPLGFIACEGEVIQGLYVTPSARGEGVGRRLLDAAKAEAETLVLWCFEENHGARRFYAREGFTEVAASHGAGNDQRLPDVKLRWERKD
ncbi:MAG: GNAT family N-acetyltransferase [Rhodobacteraceae bacterium]|nr:GNAT family N-acetyltransferase [Paracoccaceae bacterium]